MDLHSTGPERICIITDGCASQKKKNELDFQPHAKFVAVSFYF